MKKLCLLVFISLLSISLIGCIHNEGKEETQPPGVYEEPSTTMYKNTQYGFVFSLPASWEGYSVVTGEWEGHGSADAPQSDRIVETGPMISIRHPQWTVENQRQDIPIMVFTLTQWDLLQQETFHIGAAPIGPSELGHNDAYVFALPARYNFAFPPGYEEVQEILESNPLQAVDEQTSRGGLGGPGEPPVPEDTPLFGLSYREIKEKFGDIGPLRAEGGLKSLGDSGLAEAVLKTNVLGHAADLEFNFNADRLYSYYFSIVLEDEGTAAELYAYLQNFYHKKYGDCLTESQEEGGISSISSYWQTKAFQLSLTHLHNWDGFHFVNWGWQSP